MQIRKELAKGTFWTAVGSYSRYLFSFIVSAILARLLTASDFGVIGMVLVYTGFVDLLAEFGISATVVQKRYLDRRGLSTVFWLAAAIGLTLTGISILLAPVIESFFDFEGLRVIVQVMSVNLLLVSLATVPQGLLQQKLAFKQLAALEVISALLSGIIGIALAFLGWGYWALVVQGISGKAIHLLGYFVFTRWRPLLTLQVEVIRDILSFSGNLLGYRIIYYWSRNADNLIIGRTLGSTLLGFYNQAYTVMMYPIRLLSFVINPSIQPVFAASQDEPEKIAPTYLQLLELLALITFPAGIFLHIFAGPVIRVLWGGQWETSIPVFEVLALLTMVQPLLVTSSSVFIARNKDRLLFRLGTCTSLIIIAGIALGAQYGIVGVATGYAIAYWLFATPLTLYYLAKVIEIRPNRMLAVFYKPAIITIILAPALFAFRSFNFAWTSLGILVGAGALFAVIWASAGFALYRNKFKTLLELLRQRIIPKP